MGRYMLILTSFAQKRASNTILNAQTWEKIPVNNNGMSCAGVNREHRCPLIDQIIRKNTSDFNGQNETDTLKWTTQRTMDRPNHLIMIWHGMSKCFIFGIWIRNGWIVEKLKDINHQPILVSSLNGAVIIEKYSRAPAIRKLHY